jgi:hypothetical protein
MATFTVNSSVNFDDASFSTRAGNDTYNLNGATLTIDTDTRYCANSTAAKGNLGTVTISATLGGKILLDGSKVKLIPYNTGSGNVPAIGTTITNSSGGYTGYLLGVYSALNVAPTAAGAAMPASGYIKVKNTTGAFTSGALSGIGATSTGADVVGWIEVVGVDGGRITCPRLGTTQIAGEWFEAGTTSGSANQTIQLPASLTNTYYPGVWIETAVGSGTYEFYGNAGSATTVFATDAIRGKVVWISAQGSCVISKTSFGGYLPVTGLKVRVPNVICVTCTSAAQSTNSYNVAPASRFTFDFSGGGLANVSKGILIWFAKFTGAYSITFSNCGFVDSFYLGSHLSPVSIDNLGVGIGTNVNVSAAFNFNYTFNGGTISNSSFIRYQYSPGVLSMPAAGIFNLTYSNCKFYAMLNRASTVGQSYQQSIGTNVVLTNCTFIGGSVIFLSCVNTTVTNLVYCDLITGATTSSNGLTALGFDKCTTALVNGITFGSQTNAHPYEALFGIAESTGITMRNIGTSASPLSLGSANACNYVLLGVVSGQNGDSTNIKLQRIYVSNLRGGKFVNSQSIDDGVTLESCWGAAADTIPVGSQDTIYKSMYAGGAIPTSFTSVYGTHFYDTFVSSTSGNIGLFLNEATSATSAYVTTSMATGSGFTSTGSVVMATTNDYIIWEWPHYVLGYTGFTAIASTVTGINAAANHWYEYQIDKNDSNEFNGSYKNFYYERTGGVTTNGSATVTMTSTTGIAAGDRIYHANIPAGTRVLTVDSATQVTMSANSTATAGSLTFIVSALNGETSISATLGFKLKIRAKCTTGSTSNTITGIYCTGTTDAVSQTTQYPLDYATITITVQDNLSAPIQNARVAIYKTSDNTEIMNVLTNASGIATKSVEYLSNTTVYIRVRKSSTGTRYLNNDSAGTITSSGLTSTITMITDSVAT